MKKITTSAEETEQFGLTLAKKAHGGDIFTLTGDLGTGKTCFTKGFARGLGITHVIQSPTFVLMKVYKLTKKSAQYLCHVDAYRLKTIKEFEEIGIDECLGKSNTITIIEWASKVREYTKTFPRTEIHFNMDTKDKRIITITKHSSQ